MNVNRNLNLSDWNGVWVVGEQRKGIIAGVTYELLGEGRRLADVRGTTLSVLVLGNQMEGQIEELAHYGADQVVYFDHPLLAQYNTDGYKLVLSRYLLEKRPEIVIIGATALGRDLAPRLAASVGTGLTADCTGLAIDETDNKLLQTRPAFGGNLMAVIVCPNNRPQMSTVRAGVMAKAVRCEAKAEVIKITPELHERDIIATVLEVVKDARRHVSLTDAEIIVSGGRGLGGAEGFKLIQELAGLLRGEVGASRAAVEIGWIDPAHQVGQTGTTVRPRLYIACGISGAIQHIAGMSESDIIVAINKNEKAPIFSVANYKIVGDLYKVIPEICRALRESGVSAEEAAEVCR